MLYSVPFRLVCRAGVGQICQDADGNIQPICLSGNSLKIVISFSGMALLRLPQLASNSPYIALLGPNYRSNANVT